MLKKTKIPQPGVGGNHEYSDFRQAQVFRHEKGERYFKERRVKFQGIDLKKYGISRGELQSVLRSVKLADLIDPKHPDAKLLEYLAYDQDKVEKLLEDPTLLRTPIVRTASRPPWGTARRFGRGGSERGYGGGKTTPEPEARGWERYGTLFHHGVHVRLFSKQSGQSESGFTSQDVSSVIPCSSAIEGQGDFDLEALVIDRAICQNNRSLHSGKSSRERWCRCRRTGCLGVLYAINRHNNRQLAVVHLPITDTRAVNGGIGDSHCILTAFIAYLKGASFVGGQRCWARRCLPCRQCKPPWQHKR